MSQQLINHSPDLQRLWEEGFEIEVRGAYLLMYHIPYLNSSLEIKYGVLVSTLTLAGDRTCTPDNHIAYFIGTAPCRKDGQEMTSIINSSSTYKLTDTIEANHLLSSKPVMGYKDYFEKMTTYANIISTPAKSVDSSVTEKTFRIIEPDSSESVFNYLDTNSVRGKIDTISFKLSTLKVAIIGLGGTGSYILDLVAKTPVQEIHLYDGDVFAQHNAFRAPGAPTVEILRERIKKTDYFHKIYSKMHRHIISHGSYMDDTNMEELSEMNFVFISLDRGSSKKVIVDFLEEKNIPFIDVGMGVHRVEDELLGVIRITSSTEKKRNHLKKRVTFTEGVENEYGSNIQIADLNALNATLAVIKWKKLFGFYQDFENENHTTYTINVNMLLSEDHEA